MNVCVCVRALESVCVFTRLSNNFVLKKFNNIVFMNNLETLPFDVLPHDGIKKHLDPNL